MKKDKVSMVKEVSAPYKARTKLHSITSDPRRESIRDTEYKKPSSSSKKKGSDSFENSILQWLGGSNSIRSLLRSDFDLIQAGAEGIPKSSIDALAAHLGISRKTMAEDILDLSVKTMERKAPSDKLDKRTSSHAIEIAKVIQHAYAVFEDSDKVRRWINKENTALNSMKPLQLFDTMTGLVMVNDILGRIEEGVYS